MPKKYIEYVVGEAEDYEDDEGEEDPEEDDEGDDDEEEDEPEEEEESLAKPKIVLSKKRVIEEEEREVEPYADDNEIEDEVEPPPKPKSKRIEFKILKEEEWKPTVAVRKTSNYISWHEVAALMTARAVQLTSVGIKPLIDPEGDFAPETIAKRELQNMLRKIAEGAPNPKEWTVTLGIERRLLDDTVDFFRADEVIYPRGFLEDP